MVLSEVSPNSWAISSARSVILESYGDDILTSCNLTSTAPKVLHPLLLCTLLGLGNGRAYPYLPLLGRWADSHWYLLGGSLNKNRPQNLRPTFQLLHGNRDTCLPQICGGSGKPRNGRLVLRLSAFYVGVG